MAAGLSYVFEVRREDETFAPRRVALDVWRRGAADALSFGVAMALGSVVGREAGLVWACDFLAVAPDTTIEALHPAMLRYRAGPTLSAADMTEGHVPASRLFELGLAAFLIEPDADTTERRILRQADTLLALTQARRVSCPGWFYRE